MTKWPVQKQTHRTDKKHTEHQYAKDIQKKSICLCYTDVSVYFFIYDFLYDFSKKC